MFSLANLSAAIFVLAAVARAEFFITSFSVQGNASTSLTWTSTDPDTDAEFITVELQNPSFHSQFALGTTIPSSQNSLTITTPSLLPGPGYSLQLIATNNVSDILAQTPEFDIVENKLLTSSLSAGPPSTSASSSSASSSSASSSVSASTTSGASSASAVIPSNTASIPTPSPISGSASSSAPEATSSSASLPNASGNNNNNNNNSARGLAPAGGAVAVVACFVALFL